MTNDEIRRNDEIRMTKPATGQLRVFRHSGFGFLSSFVIRHSTTWLILLLFCAWSVARAEDVSAAFDQANKFYEEGKFTEAAAAYEKMLRQGQASPALCSNLGNTMVKA